MLTRGRLLGILLTVVFLGLAIYRIDPAELVAELQRVNYVWIVPSAVATLLGYVLRTVRWRVILGTDARAPLRTLFSILIMGFATNNLLPGRLGEFWRAYLLGRKRQVRKTYALASVFIERVFDGLVLILLLGIVSSMVRLPENTAAGQLISAVRTFSAVVFLGATIGVGMLIWRPLLLQGIVRFMLRPLPSRIGDWVDGVFDAFVAGLDSLKRPRVLVGAVGLSLGVWLLEGASYYLLSRGVMLGLSPDEVVPAMGLTLVMVNLGIMVPSGPGYIGTQEFFGTTALAVFGANAEAALVLVLVSHAIQYVLVTGLGLVFFAREHLSPGRIATVTEDAREHPATPHNRAAHPAAGSVEAEPAA